MFSKLLAIILASTVTASALLVVRQQRYEIAHELTVRHGRLLAKKRTLWQLRAEVARRCRPEQIRALMAGLGVSWTALPAEAPPPPEVEARRSEEQQGG